MLGLKRQLVVTAFLLIATIGGGILVNRAEAQFRVFRVEQGGTERESFAKDALIVGNNTDALQSTTSPTVGFIIATSTTPSQFRNATATLFTVTNELWAPGTKNVGDYFDYFNGSFVETFNATTTSDGSTVTMHLGNSTNSGDLTMRFSTGDVTLTAPTSTPLTAGSDTSPTENFVFIQESDQVIRSSTSNWPTTEHIKIAYFFVPSAGFVQTNGIYINQNWNDHAADDSNQGHETHIGEKIRRLQATYFSGVDGNGTDGYLTPTAGNVELISTAGVVYQMHKHTVPAFDTSTGDLVLVKNWSGDAFHDITNLYDIVDDSTGTTIGNNKFFNLVIWGVANKTGQMQQMMINLPSGSYNTQSGAENDTSGFDDLTIPAEFKHESSTGFLIARITIQMKTGGGTWVVASSVDLRGLSPVNATGGTAAGSLVNFPDNTFTIFDESDVTKIGAFDIGTLITTGNTRTVQFLDADGVMALSNTTLTAGSVPFINASTQLTEDNTNLFWDDTNNHLGVGTSSPWGQLSIDQLPDIGKPVFVVSDTGTTTPFLAVDAHGRVALGTNTATSTLQVEGGDVHFVATGDDEGFFFDQSTGNVSIGTVSADGIVHADGGTGDAFFIIEKDDAMTARLDFHNDGVSEAHIELTTVENLELENDSLNGNITFKINKGGADTEAMRILGSSGFVGFGTPSPDNTLEAIVLTNSRGFDIKGGANNIATEVNLIRADTGFSLDESLGQFAFQGTSNLSNRFSFGRVEGFVDGGVTGTGDAPGRVSILTTPDGSGTPVVQFTVKNDGKTGVGTTTPWAVLSVEQLAGTKPVFVVSDTGTSSPSFIIDGHQRVGIGTSTPQTTLHISAGANATTTYTIGELGDLTSSSCFNVKNDEGEDISFYFHGTTQVIQTGQC